MVDNVVVAVVSVVFFVVPILVAIIFFRAHDFWSSRKTVVGDNYRCSSCGFVFPRKGAKLSGWENHPYGIHVDCPNCGATVAQFVDVKMVSS